MSPTMQDRPGQAAERGSLEQAASAILVDRITRLAPEARKDLMDLVMAVRDGAGDAEHGEIVDTIVEVLFPERMGSLVREPPAAYATKALTRRSLYIGGRIRELRKKRRMTQEGLARKADLPQSHISRLEVGKHSPSFKTLEKIAKALGCEVGDIDPSC